MEPDDTVTTISGSFLPMEDPYAAATRLREAAALVESSTDWCTDPDHARVSARRKLLEEATELIDGDRNASYGEPIDDFTRTALYLQAYLDGCVKTRGSLIILPHDVAIIQMFVKLSRLVESPSKRDHWVDLAGYAGCGYDTIEAQQS